MRKHLLIPFLLAVFVLDAAHPVAAMHPNDPPLPLPSPQSAPLTAAPTPAVDFVCGYDEVHAKLLEGTTADSWMDWIEKLSGAQPVMVGGEQRIINNRHSFSLFNRNLIDGQISYGFDYLVETVKAWYLESQIEIDPFVGPAWSNFNKSTWNNLILTIPGTKYPNEVVMLTAHFDSTNGQTYTPPTGFAPGADDNASGSATLLEAARLLRISPPQRTVKLIWFTGEEQGLVGSGNYVDDHDVSNVVGVINLDMYAFDSNNDRCFELHVSDPLTYTAAAPASERIGQCFVDSIEAYSPILTYDYFTENAIDASDHRSFWMMGIGAIEVGENFSTNSTPGGCVGGDMSHYYHQVFDTASTINTTTGFAIHRAALGTFLAMAGVLENKIYFPQIVH